ncbi:MAG: hypothetical protein HFE74_06440 [Firmicutes bacterium]|nr:hypothetical protein [Bacillota bacterium]
MIKKLKSLLKITTDRYERDFGVAAPEQVLNYEIVGGDGIRIIDMGDKEVEKKCLELVLKDKPQCQFGKEILKSLNSTIIECEKPDFVIDKVGIEHFLVDLLFTTKRNRSMSIERQNTSAITEKVNHYKDNPNDLDSDIENGKAAKTVEDLVNSQVNAVSDFSCQRFIDNFKQIFEKHYEKINEYRKKCDKLGFIIEIPYIHISNSTYVIIRGKHKFCQAVRTMPMPKQIIDYVWDHNDLDFSILCIRPIGNITKSKDVSIIYIDPKNKNLFDQKVFLCDEFNFRHKFSNKDVVKLDSES